MKLSDFDYDLPDELIAVEPANPRDSSRLLVLRRNTNLVGVALGALQACSAPSATPCIEHRNFFHIVDYLNEGDVLVVNDSKVFPARLFGRKEKTGGQLEVFLHRKIDSDEKIPPTPFTERGRNVWQCLIGGKGARTGMKIIFDMGLIAEIIENNNDSTWNLQFNLGEKEMMAVVFEIGAVPLPPYIIKSKCKNQNGKLRNNISDKINYQTVYAGADKIGSVAAPTAGLHFTDQLLEKIRDKGIKIEHVTLHVGLGTFAPVKTDNILEHKMHAEWYEVSKETIEAILSAKEKGKKVVSVGTTSTRVLETVFSRNDHLHNAQRITHNDEKLRVMRSTFRDLSGWTDIFIYPGYEFKAIDGMVTNFHLPKSTLIMLVSALAGRDRVMGAYQEAIANKYRFYSYGDAMLII